MAFVAKKIYLTKGVGKHRERLSSFELALRSAGIAACNIVRVSSIFPPNCKLISRAEGLKHLNTLTSICPVLCRFVKLCQQG